MVDMWTCRDGSKIKVKDMGDRHLLNTIRMIERVCEAKRYAAMRDGERMLSTLQGECAIDDVERGLDALNEAGAATELFAPPIYELMIAEACRRGLKKEGESW